MEKIGGDFYVHVLRSAVEQCLAGQVVAVAHLKALADIAFVGFDFQSKRLAKGSFYLCEGFAFDQYPAVLGFCFYVTLVAVYV